MYKVMDVNTDIKVAYDMIKVLYLFVFFLLNNDNHPLLQGWILKHVVESWLSCLEEYQKSIVLAILSHVHGEKFEKEEVYLALLSKRGTTQVEHQFLIF